MLEELRKDGVNFFERTAASFLARVGDQLPAVRRAAGAGDAPALTQTAHALKGSAAEPRPAARRRGRCPARWHRPGEDPVAPTDAADLVEELRARKVEVATAAADGRRGPARPATDVAATRL